MGTARFTSLVSQWCLRWPSGRARATKLKVPRRDSHCLLEKVVEKYALRTCLRVLRALSVARERVVAALCAITSWEVPVSLADADLLGGGESGGRPAGSGSRSLPPQLLQLPPGREVGPRLHAGHVALGCTLAPRLLPPVLLTLRGRRTRSQPVDGQKATLSGW
ncbi:hypothetical protein E2C01_011487 [Portunus trituberculatus]|uniref:Uncharacterized protein n=1 Tax=Portunus trituberculatus TaxID=210409 RepID=A0A5B7DBJ3_PORTR|nr:hypothetical protein [Portunus trituberculatus]